MLDISGQAVAVRQAGESIGAQLFLKLLRFFEYLGLQVLFVVFLKFIIPMDTFGHFFQCPGNLTDFVGLRSGGQVDRLVRTELFECVGNPSERLQHPSQVKRKSDGNGGKDDGDEQKCEPKLPVEFLIVGVGVMQGKNGEGSAGNRMDNRCFDLKALCSVGGIARTFDHRTVAFGQFQCRNVAVFHDFVGKRQQGLPDTEVEVYAHNRCDGMDDQLGFFFFGCHERPFAQRIEEEVEPQQYNAENEYRKRDDPTRKRPMKFVPHHTTLQFDRVHRKTRYRIRAVATH